MIPLDIEIINIVPAQIDIIGNLPPVGCALHVQIGSPDGRVRRVFVFLVLDRGINALQVFGHVVSSGKRIARDVLFWKVQQFPGCPVVGEIRNRTGRVH